jgi:adenylate cyclase class 2
MNTEIEVKFLRINHDEMRAKLQQIGATCQQPMRFMKRAIFEDKHGELRKKNGYIRVRDEGDKVTLTYKQFDALSIDGAKEIETGVTSFDETVQILIAANLELKSLQESKRETWHFEGVEVVLDEWPWLEPYIEIESNTEAALKGMAEKLHLDWSDAVFGDVMVAYRAQYPNITAKWGIGDMESVRFSDPVPDIFNN